MDKVDCVLRCEALLGEAPLWSARDRLLYGVAHFDRARLTRFMPDGRIDRVVELPVPRPTTLCFGGDGLDTLFVTPARINMTEAALREAPRSGSLFAIHPGVRGLPEPVFGQGPP